MKKVILLTVMVIAAVGSAGCYRTVANIHVDASNNLVVNKIDNAQNDQVPPVVKTEDGLQEVRIDRKRYKLTIQGRVQEIEKTRSSPEGIPRWKTFKETFRSPNTVRLEKEGRLTIKDENGERDLFSSNDVDEIFIRLRYRDSNRSKARAGIALTITGSLLLGGGLGWIIEPSFAVPFLCSSVLFLAPGIPLWISGGRRLAHDKKSNRGLKISGIVLTITGASLIAAGAAMSALFGMEIPILMGLGFSAPLLAIGIPLWIIGSRRLERSPSSAALPDPVIAFSPETSTYSFGLKWRL